MRVSGDYGRDGYALVHQLLARESCNGFLRQFKESLDRSGMTLDRVTHASPLLRREAVEMYSHYFPPMLALLWGLTPAIEQLVGVRLQPSYSYLRIYREGDICRVHCDRPSCEHSLSLTLDYSDGVEWNLDIATTRREPETLVTEDFGDTPYSSIAMRPGDGVLYRGVHHRHGRLTPNPNHWSAHLFLHWVDRDGPFAEHAFDGNTALTQPVNFSFR